MNIELRDICRYLAFYALALLTQIIGRLVVGSADPLNFTDALTTAAMFTVICAIREKRKAA